MVSCKMKKRRNGFTLIEMSVVLFILTFIAAIVFANYREGERQFALQRSAHKLAQDIRSVQAMAVASREIEGLFPKGYGIYFEETGSNEYILFADVDGNGLYDEGDEEIKRLKLEQKVVFVEIFPGSPLTIVFQPPDPSVLISSGDGISTSSSIFLNYQNGAGKTINVNKAGLIEIE